MGRTLIGAAFVAALSGLARAQEKPKEPPPQEEKLPPGRAVIQAGDALSWQEGEVTVTFLTGGVTLRRSDIQITAARMLAWSRKGGDSFEELYAEGGVVFTRENQSLHCERFYVDVRDDNKPLCMIVDFRGEAFSKQFKERFYVRAKEARMVEKGRFQANDISLSTCSYGVPHYHISIGEGTLVGHGEHEKKGKWDIFPYDSWALEAVEIYPELLGAPIFFIPAMVLSPALAEFPLRHLEGGHNSRFGYYAYTEWGTKLKKEDENHKWRPWAEVVIKADWRELRGGGYGLDFRYKWKEDYEGYVNTYYMHDLGRDPNLGFNAKFGPLVEGDRGLAHFFHRQNFDEHWRLELESYYVSDRDLREEFFTKEFREEKEPESAAYLRWVDGPMGAYLYERNRLNPWQTQTEYLPRFNYSLFQVPVARGPLADVYLNERLDAGRLRRRFDDSLDAPSEDTWRIDSVTELSLPVDCRYFQVAPFAQERLTYYEYDLQGDRELRALPAAGARVSTQLHATWPDVGWEAVGLRGLRHIMEFEGRYAAGFDQAVKSGQLFAFDEVDQVAPFEEVAIGMHHRFKTKDETGKPFEFLSLGVEVEYYPNARRDTTSLRVDDYMPPFNYILVSPRTDGTFPERHWSNVHYGMAFQPRNFFQAYGSGEYNPAAGYEEVRQYGVTVWPWEKTSLSAGQTYVRGVTNAYTGTFTTAFTEKWTISLQAQYDFKVNDFLSQRIVVSRDYHDFLLEGVVEHNTTTNERRIFVSFVPKFLGPKGERRSHAIQPLVPVPQYTNPEP